MGFPVQHGDCREGHVSPENMAWQNMRRRCNDRSRPEWPRYGGRGIRVCERWGTFENFLADMGRKPSPQHSLDRIDNDGDYEPGNCRWATAREQTLNSRHARMITFGERTLCLKDWGRVTGLGSNLLWRRLSLGWSVERALTAPKRRW